jgi:hypothetical protein
MRRSQSNMIVKDDHENMNSVSIDAKAPACKRAKLVMRPVGI